QIRLVTFATAEDQSRRRCVVAVRKVHADRLRSQSGLRGSESADASREPGVVIHEIQCDQCDAFVPVADDERGGVERITHAFPRAPEIITEAGEFYAAGWSDDAPGNAGVK